MRLSRLLAVGLSLLATSSLRADFIDPGLPGATTYDGWANLTAENISEYPGFMGLDPWPGPIGSNQPGSGDAEFNKISGYGYPAGQSIYSFGPGTFSISDDTPLENLSTIVFQIDIGSGEEGLTLTDGPAFSFNGGAQNIEAAFFRIISAVPGDPGPFGDPVVRYTYAWQWNLSSIPDINSFQINWSVISHAQTYALQLNQGDTFVQVIPEPSTWALMGLGLGGMLVVVWRRKVGRVGHASLP